MLAVHVRKERAMRELSDAIKGQLREIFGSRVTFDPIERRLYSHDVGEFPKLVQPLIGNTMPAGVVRPHTEQELERLVRLANDNEIPLVPRGMGTSGYGGVLPTKGGLVVDFFDMHSILETDIPGSKVTVEPGVIWRDLDVELAKNNLALRLYPSSATSSTVGGWLAQGGTGYGSFEYGWFRDNVVSARVLLASGEWRTFTGSDLDLISGAEGITGLITRVTLRVRDLEDEEVIAGGFSDVASLAASLQQIAGGNIPLWSVSFTNPEMARLKNQFPPKLEHGEPVQEERPALPEEYTALFVFPSSRRDEIVGPLAEIIEAQGGHVLDEKVAREEWDDRFSVMKVKRLGPSLIPTELVVPLEALHDVLSEIGSKIQQPLVLDGILTKGREVVILGFIPHDQRSLRFNVAFVLALSAIKIAKAHGGRPYASGLYFAREAPRVLGAQRLDAVRDMKAKLDPNRVMNPGKILDNGLLGTFMGLAEIFEPLARPVGNVAKSPLGERFEAKMDIPADVAWYAYACAQCGACVAECDQFYGRGWESQTPRGKWFFLRDVMEGRAEFNQKMVDSFLACTTCEVCNVKCPLELPIEPAWLDMRGRLIHDEDRLTFPPFEVMAASLRKERNIWASYSKDRADWMKEEVRARVKDKAEIGYFAGCTASFVEQDIAQATTCLLTRAGVEFTYMGDGEACCGIPMLVAGLWDAFEEIMRHNIEGMRELGVKTVVTSCPACWLSWSVYYPRWAEKLGIDYPFQAKHYSQVLAESAAAGKLKLDRPLDMKVTWHDSCHMGRAGGIYEPPRELIRAIPGIEFVEMEHNREEAHCCGSVLSLVADPVAAQRIGEVRLREAQATGAQALVACCPCCEVQFRVTARKSGTDFPVIDLAHLVCDAADIDYKDPTEYGLKMWGTFEAMINLLKPENMADLMAELLPQLMEAMPAPMRGMMGMVTAMPDPLRDGMLAVMGPVMPALFPRLLPGMMPKVMPDMLAAVGRRVPMPEHMRELMPDLLPMAMNNLMPKMLPEVIPFFMPKMIEYLKAQ
jgi:Fe-S oxidoreductase/FAD/FMN-containing dehydrogenase